MIAFTILLLSASAAAYCSYRCDRLDIETGRRDPMILSDDYGSNIGFYLPWTYLYGGSLFIAFVAFLKLAPTIIG